MTTIRKNTFETNSSSTHSFAISRDSHSYERLEYIFSTILHGDKRHDWDYTAGIEDIDDESQLLELVKLLNEAQQILLEGTEDYD